MSYIIIINRALEARSRAQYTPYHVLPRRRSLAI